MPNRRKNISQPNHMLWVVKRTVWMRRFFWAPKTYGKMYGKENIYNFTLKICVYSKLDIMGQCIRFQCAKSSLKRPCWLLCVCEQRKGPGETARMIRPVWVLATRWCDKSRNLTYWLKLADFVLSCLYFLPRSRSSPSFSLSFSLSLSL